MAFEPLRDTISRMLARRGTVAIFDAAEVCAMAERIIAAELPAVAGRVRARCVRGDTVHLAVQHSAVGSEIHLARETIVHEIRQRFPRIRQLRTSTDPAAFRDSLE